MSKEMDVYAELDNFIEDNEGQVSLTDVAKHFAEYGYKYAVAKGCECERDRKLNPYCHDAIEWVASTFSL